MIINNAAIKSYITIARPDHWTKHVFILPGMVFAWTLCGRIEPPQSILTNIIFGMIAACLIGSANYTLNEWLDAMTDCFHPEKRDRVSCQGSVTATGVYIQYFALLIIGISLASFVNKLFFLSGIAFFISGIIYNVKPIRAKDRTYWDIIVEAINNPIRLFMGWSMVTGDFIPPLSIVLCYYFGGGFLMTAKRLSEYRHICKVNGVESAGQYRASFQKYNSEILISLCAMFMILSSVLLGVFFYKYRIEYILLLPIYAFLFAYYLKNSLKDDSLAQKPEKIFNDRKLVLILIILIIGFIFLSRNNLPALEELLFSRFGELHFD